MPATTSRVSRVVGAAAAGYLLGTFPSADIAARLATRGSLDLRDEGSGNPGALNAMAVIGTKWGLGIMAADIAKGAIAGIVGRTLAGSSGANAASTAAVVGHCYPVWNGFAGGKGVATSVGQCVATFPVYMPIDLAVAAATAASPRWKQRAFVATAMASLAWVGSAVLWWRKGWPNAWAPRPTVALPIGAAVSSAVIAGRFLSANRAKEEPMDADDDQAGDPEQGIMLPLRPVFRLEDGTVFVSLPPQFRDVLGLALADLRGRILAGDATVDRLFPTAYDENPELDDEWQRLMSDELLESRLATLDVVESSLNAETIDDDQAAAWMSAANSMRLMLGAQLGVDRDDWEPPPGDEHIATYQLFDYLGHIIASLVEALDQTTPSG